MAGFRGTFRLAAAVLALSGTSVLASPTMRATDTTGPPVVYQTGPDAPLITDLVLSAEQARSKRTEQGPSSKSVCWPQPTGIAHRSEPDTAAAFREDPYYAEQALAAPVPSGYDVVFINTKASPQVKQYRGFTLLKTYDVQACADRCNKISGCKSFNVYFERDPSVNPDKVACPNPSSVTNIKCVWWSSEITVESNTNTGQWRAEFEVAIAGSNGYTNPNVHPPSSSTSSSASATHPVSSSSSEPAHPTTTSSEPALPTTTSSEPALPTTTSSEPAHPTTTLSTTSAAPTTTKPASSSTTTSCKTSSTVPTTRPDPPKTDLDYELHLYDDYHCTPKKYEGVLKVTKARVGQCIKLSDSDSFFYKTNGNGNCRLVAFDSFKCTGKFTVLHPSERLSSCRTKFDSVRYQCGH